jgi:hypothetical protein
MVVEVFRLESWRGSSNEGSESLAIVQPLTAAGTPELVEAAEECQKRRRLHETLRAMALIPC